MRPAACTPRERTRPRPLARRLAMWLACVCLLVVAAACERGTGRAGTRAPSRDDLRGISLDELAVRPKRARASQYGGPTEHDLTAIETAVADALAPLPVTHLPALSTMARELAAAAPDQVNVPPALVDGLMAWSGLVDPSPRLVVVELASDRAGCHRRPAAACAGAIESLVQQVQTTLPETEDPANTAFGVGVVGLGSGHTRMMVAVLERATALEPLPVQLDALGHVELQGRLLGGRVRPQVEVVEPGGRWRTLPVSLSTDGTFATRVSCADRGAHQIEILADGRYGPEVAANFPVYCGESPPDTLQVVVERVAPDVTGDQVARATFLYLNEERQARGLPPLRWDADAAAVAYDHSSDMRDNAFVGHHSPQTGDVMQRFAAAGLTGVVIRENVARGYGPKGIHDSLMASPGHRVNILAPDVTHVGVGAVLGPSETNVPGAPRPVYATQNFFKKPGAGAPADAELSSGLQAAVDAMRNSEGLPAAQWDDALSDLALRRAKALAKDKQPPADFDQAVFALGYDAVESHQISSLDFDALATVDLWRGPALIVGVGVVRVRKRKEDESFLAVVLVASSVAP